MTTFQPGISGIYHDLPAETYHAAPGVSNSMLGKMDPPARLPVYLSEKREVTPWMRMGTLIHHKILEPDKPLPKLIVPPAKYPHVGNAKIEKGTLVDWHWGANYCKDWEKEKSAEGFDIIEQDELDTIVNCVKAIVTDPYANKVFATGQSEVSVFVDNFHGAFAKARIDWVAPTNYLADIKKVQPGMAGKEAFQKLAFNRRYHVQAAYYLDLWNAASTEEDRKESFIFVVVEDKAPYLVACYTVSAGMLELGRETYMKELDMYVECCHEQKWPGYPSGFTELELPKWLKQTTTEDYK
jgi:hypothetical protein